jgi:hypothetical protein
MTDKKVFAENGLCTATCSEETESCKGYKWSLLFGGCQYLGRCSGKCLRPERMGNEQGYQPYI